MRYGSLSIETVFDKLKSAGCDRLLVVPLYPQYSASTSASVIDEIARILQRTRNQPALRTVRAFYSDNAYIAALATRIRAHWAQNGRGDHLPISFSRRAAQYAVCVAIRISANATEPPRY